MGKSSMAKRITQTKQVQLIKERTDFLYNIYNKELGPAVNADGEKIKELTTQAEDREARLVALERRFVRYLGLPWWQKLKRVRLSSGEEPEEPKPI